MANCGVRTLVDQLPRSDVYGRGYRADRPSRCTAALDILQPAVGTLNRADGECPQTRRPTPLCRSLGECRAESACPWFTLSGAVWRRCELDHSPPEAPGCNLHQFTRRAPPMRRYPLETLHDPRYPETLDPDVSSVGSYIGVAA